MDPTQTRTLQLFVRGGSLALPDGTTLAIGPDPITIGRDPACQVVLSDPEVSGVHAELSATSQGVRIRDLDSTNGTLVGPVRVQDACLVDQAVITIGGTRLELRPTPKARVDVGFSSSFGSLVGSSPKMRRIFQILERVAPTDLSVLVNGETGTGKELVARALHDASARKDKPFVVVDCGSIPASLAEGILFGHEKGAFTGAIGRRNGALLEANGGTLFFDELGELPIDLQPKLLRALSERQVQRVGSSAVEPLDVRVVAATRRDLGREMNHGTFRSDLFFRIAQIRVEMPPLRERVGDIPMIAEAMCQRMGMPDAIPTVLRWIGERRAGYDWPGNVRELANVVSVAATLAADFEAIDDVLSVERATREPPEPMMTAPARAEGEAVPYGEARQNALRAFELAYFQELMKASGGNISEMARRAVMERHHVRAFLRKLGLRP